MVKKGLKPVLSLPYVGVYCTAEKLLKAFCIKEPVYIACYISYPINIKVQP
jgi:hypothetical protein